MKSSNVTVPPLTDRILLNAAEIVKGDRNQTHGTAENSFQSIANLWNAYLLNTGHTVELSPGDVAQMMVLLKIARVQAGTPVFDHFIDMAGYSALAGRLTLEN